MAKFKKKSVFVKVIAVLAAIGAAVGAVFGIKAISDKVQDPKETVHPTFAVGGLLDETGQFDEEEKRAIFTEKSFSAKGLEVKLDFQAKVTYQVFFYDKLDHFISATQVYEESAAIDVPLGAYARMEVTPVIEDSTPIDYEVKWHEIFSITSQFDIRVDKNQKFALTDFTQINVAEKFTKYNDTKYDTSSGTNVSEDGLTLFEYTLPEGSSKMFLYSGAFKDDCYIVMTLVKAEGGFEVFGKERVVKLSMDNLVDVKGGDKVYLSMYEAHVETINPDMFLYVI